MLAAGCYEQEHTGVSMLQERLYGRHPGGFVHIYVTAREEMAELVRSDRKAHLLPRLTWGALNLDGGGEYVGKGVRAQKWKELGEIGVNVRELGEPPHNVDLLAVLDALGRKVNCRRGA